MYYAVDKRERAILDYIERADKQKMFCPQHLTTGDFILFNDSGRALAVIERKTWKDFADSIKDGRMENIEKLQEFSEQTGARIAYLIDDECDPDEDASFQSIAYKNIRAHMDHLIWDINIRMIELHANGPRSVCARLEAFARNISTFKGRGPEEKGGNHSELASRPRTKSDSEIRAAALMAFPHLGPVGARALSAVSLARLFDREHTLALLEKAKVPAARKIAIVMDVERKENKQHFQNCLAAIPLISSKKAAAILDVAPLSQLVGDWDGAAKKLRADKSLKLGAKSIEKIRALLYEH